MRQLHANLQVVSQRGSHFPSTSHSFCTESSIEHGKSAATLQIRTHTDTQNILPTLLSFKKKKPISWLAFLQISELNCFALWPQNCSVWHREKGVTSTSDGRKGAGICDHGRMGEGTHFLWRHPAVWSIDTQHDTASTVEQKLFAVNSASVPVTRRVQLQPYC